MRASQAVLIAGLAALELLKAEQGVEELTRASACGGLEAGELTALVYAGALDFEDALRLLQVRFHTFSPVNARYWPHQPHNQGC